MRLSAKSIRSTLVLVVLVGVGGVLGTIRASKQPAQTNGRAGKSREGAGHRRTACSCDAASGVHSRSGGTPPTRSKPMTPATGAATALAKVTVVIVTARVRLRAAAGCEAPPPQARAAEFFQVFRGQEASFMRKIGTSFRKPSRQKPAIII